jgi:hypothetical protein
MHMHQLRRNVISQRQFYEELQQAFHYFPQYQIKILLDLKAKLKREVIFKLAT